MSAVPSHEGRLAIRAARPGDEAVIFAMVREFAAFESLPVDATQERLAAALFGRDARVFCDIAEWRDAGGTVQAAGSAIWFYNFSTFRSRHGIYLEDLFVRPAFRRRGIGTALLAQLARRCLEEDLVRLDWQVLGWNRNAIAFYERHGAAFLDDWRICRVEAAGLSALAER